MSASTTVRRARPDDAEGLVRAHEAAWDATLAGIVGRPLAELAPLEARVERARQSLATAPEEAAAWVAERGGEIVGMATAIGPELRDLYVVPTAWGSGAAAALTDAVLERIRGLGAREAFLWVGEANTRARRFYEREGWRPDGEVRHSPLGPPEARYRRALDRP